MINWHARLGLVNYDDVTLMENHKLADRVHIPDTSRNTCDTFRECRQARGHKAQTDTSRSAMTDEIGAVPGVNIKTIIKPQDYDIS